MEKVLVYGASGDQGVPLVNTLIKNGYKIRAASRYPENYNSEIEGDVAVSYTHLTLPTILRV